MRKRIIRAVLFLYLNRHGYNGLCRYNNAGEFNVPFGRYKNLYFPEAELLAAAKVLPKARLTCVDFVQRANPWPGARSVGDFLA